MHRRHPYAGYDSATSGSSYSHPSQPSSHNPPPRPAHAAYQPLSPDPHAYQPGQNQPLSGAPLRLGAQTPTAGPPIHITHHNQPLSHDYRPGPSHTTHIAGYQPAPYGGESHRPPIHLDPALPTRPPPAPPTMGPPIRMGSQMSRPPPPPPPPAAVAYQHGVPAHSPSSVQGLPSHYAPPRPLPPPPSQSSPRPPLHSPYDRDPYQAPWPASSDGSYTPQQNQAYSGPALIRPAPQSQPQSQSQHHTSAAPNYDPWSTSPAVPHIYDYSAQTRELSFGPDRQRTHRRESAENGPYSRGKSTRQSRQAASHLDREDPRTAEEKPCRTLFVRNIGNSVDAAFIRDHFARFGEIRTFFERVSKRGICFITYFDLRGAELAKRECHAMEFNGRKVDVHYSLPKDQDTSKRCDRDQNQGTLFMLLKRHPRALTDSDFRNIFSAFGEIRSIRRYKDQKNARFLEFYDSRACVAAHDAMGGKDWSDASGSGQWDVKYAWDASMVGKTAPKGEDLDVTSTATYTKEPFSGRAPPPAGHPAALAYGSPAEPSGTLSAQDYRASPHFSHPPVGSFQQGSAQARKPTQQMYGSYPTQPSAARRIRDTPPPAPRPWGSNPYASPSPSQSNSGPASVSVVPGNLRRSASLSGIPSTSASPPVGVGPSAESSEAQQRLEQAQRVQQLLASLSDSATGIPSPSTLQHPSAAEAAADGHTALPGLPANIASLLANVTGSPPAHQPPSPVRVDSRNHQSSSLSSPGTNSRHGSAQEAQNSIAAMLSLLEKQQEQQQLR